MSDGARRYRGVSADERRAGRRAALIDAALDVLEENGVDGLTMTAVCARARLTERYFYESFANRDELLGALYDASQEAMDAAMYHALEGAPADLLDRCRAAAGAMIGTLLDDPRRARLYLEASSSAVLRDRSTRSVAMHAELLAAQMRELRGLDARRHEAPLRLGTLVVIGGIAHAVRSVIDGSLPLARETLVEECARLAVGVADAILATTG